MLLNNIHFNVQPLNLTKLRRNSRPKLERKSGRKRPRLADLDQSDREQFTTETSAHLPQIPLGSSKLAAVEHKSLPTKRSSQQNLDSDSEEMPNVTVAALSDPTGLNGFDGNKIG
jgi:hypothetical protein